MYKISKVSDMAIDPVMATCPVGRITDDRLRYANLCIYAQGVTASRILVNSEVLRQALLNSPEITQALGFEPIVEKSVEKAVEKPKPAAKAKAKPKAEPEEVDAGEWE